MTRTAPTRLTRASEDALYVALAILPARAAAAALALALGRLCGRSGVSLDAMLDVARVGREEALGAPAGELH